ncbi:MAG: AmmeMemoRadiSam system protein B [Candidatus Omnitrophica bacterium]|nr:AmmeMemoRadiSam system protein B [Candidatus Omnitrophota bacterium]
MSSRGPRAGRVATTAGQDVLIRDAIRRPSVAGYYYPADPDTLRNEVEALAKTEPPMMAACAVIVPHGSFRHSGAIAGATLARVVIPRRCLIIGPSHTDGWRPWSLLVGGAYRTPLGDVPVDSESAEALRARCPFLEPDASFQRGEHAIEVVLPFLQHLGPQDLTITPIIMGCDNVTECWRLAEAIAHVVRMHEEPVLLIASSDLSHYQTEPNGAEQDRRLVARLCALDGPGLVHDAQRESAGMCGYGAAACVLETAKALGARQATLAAYGTSVAAGGDPNSVTGYAGILVQ